MCVLVHINWLKNLFLLLYTLMLFCAIGQFLTIAEYFIVGLDHISCVYSPSVGMEIASTSCCYKSCGCGNLWKYLLVALREGFIGIFTQGSCLYVCFILISFARSSPERHQWCMNITISNISFCWLSNFCLSDHSKVTLTDDFWVWAFIISFLDPLWVAYSYFCLYYTGLLIFFWMIYGNFSYIQIVISY